MSRIVRAARALVEGKEERDFGFVIEAGKIAAIGPFEQLRAAHPDADRQSFGDDVGLVPGFINGHSHGYQILLRGWADDLTFARWRSEALYRVVPQLTPENIYWIFVAAFSEMLAAGITTVAEFFYLNGAGNAHAQAAIRAAQETGIRLVLARTWMDAEYAPPEFRESIDQAVSRTAELIAQFPQIEICVAPHSLHAASPEMILAAMAFAEQHDCLVHMHVAEAEYEGEQMLAAYGATPVVLLDRLGVLNRRIVAIHAIYLTEDEKKLLAASGARIVHNPMTNQYLGDGTCDLTGLHKLGIPIGLGTDADVKPSLIDEMRAASLLQKLALRDGSGLGAAAAYRFGTVEGAAVLGISAGEFSIGAHADFTVLDVRAIDPWTPLLNGLVYRGESGWIRETYVGGVQVWNGGRSALARRAQTALAQLASMLDLNPIARS